MSAALLGLALKAKLHSQTRKMVLIKLVDCCHEDGTRIYPSLATIAEDAECSVPTARRVMHLFVRVGLLRLVKEGGSGARSTNHYEMDVELLARLRRRELWPALEAAAQHDPLPDSEGDEDAPADAKPTVEGGDPGPNKGVTVEGYHGDRLPNGEEGYHPDDTQPLSKTPHSEREGAHERESRPASTGEPVAAGSDPASASPVPTFEEFLDAYPHARGDNRFKQRSAWEALPFGQRQPAIDGIGAFIAERKAGGLKSRLASEQYLAGRCWIGLEKQAQARQAKGVAGAPVNIAGFGRDWWLMVLDRISQGQRPGFWLQQAEAGKAMTATSADLETARRRIGEVKPFACDGPEIEAWRPWLAAKGARIPVFNGTFRVFLPGPTPPGGTALSAVPDDVTL